MILSDKEQIYRNVWQCAYKRRYVARIAENWEHYYGEQQTVLMCLKIAKWNKFDSEKPTDLKQ
jgi:hypothetical protein